MVSGSLIVLWIGFFSVTKEAGGKMVDGFIVTKDGRKVDVQLPYDEEKDYYLFHQTVGLYTDNTVLKDVWVLVLYKIDFFARSDQFNREFVKEIKYNHEPTKEEILWAMSAHGLTRGDMAFVEHGYELDMSGD